MLLELRYALRRLRTSPGFAVTAIVTLALAIGTTTAMVGVLDAVLFRRLPFPQADRLVVVWQELPSQAVREARSAFGTADEWRRASRSLDDVAVLDPVDGAARSRRRGRAGQRLARLAQPVRAARRRAGARPPVHRS